MKSLWDRVRQRQCISVAVGGMAKNTGKTVALNYFIRAAQADRRAIGLTSIGRDGETWDILNFKLKPPINVLPGAIIATSEQALPKATAGLRVLATTGFDGPLGEVVLAEVVSAGAVELAGPSRKSQLVEVIQQLDAAGAEIVFIDGALDRQSFTDPNVADCCILATGAELAEAMDEVVKITRDRVRQFLLPVSSAEIARHYQPGNVVVIDNRELKVFPNYMTIIKSENFWRQLEDASIIIFSGSLLNNTLMSILQSGINISNLTIVVKDVTRLFVDGDTIAKLWAAGGKLLVIRPANLLAITINPTSSEGQGFNSLEFHKIIRQAIPEVPIYDLVEGLGPV